MKIKDFSKVLFIAMIGTMGISSCADSWEELRKEKYEEDWIKTFGKVDPNHTWNMATQVTADLAIKEDALTEYTFKVYTSDPIWGTDAKLLAKATVKTDEIGYAETQIKFDAPSSQERYYITRTDSHGRRLLKVSDINNKKIGVKFGITMGNAGSKAVHKEVSFDSLKIENPYTLEWINEKINDPNVIDFKDRGNIRELNQLGYITKVTEDNFAMPKVNTDFNYRGNDKVLGEYIIIIAGNGVTIESDNMINFTGFDIIIAPGASLTFTKCVEVSASARIYVMEGGTLNACVGSNPGDGQTMQQQNFSLRIESINSLFWNGGTVNVDYLAINKGLFYNAETGILPGTENNPNDKDPESHINFTEYKGTGTLTNFGKISVDRIYGNANHSTLDKNTASQSEQNGTINNGCFIEVKELFCIKDLNIAANSALECETFIINSATFRENSIIRSEVFSAQNASDGWTFIGDTGSALISTQKATYLHDGGIHVNGSIYFESNEFGDDTDLAEINRAYSAEVGTATGSISTVGNAPILIIPDHDYNGEDISKYDCVGHGNIPQEFKAIMDENIEWAIAFEDLGAIGDYDFNDVVIGVSQDDAKIKVTALAAGGTLPADVYYKNEKLGEIHELLNSTETNKPINVINSRNEKIGKRKIYEIDPKNFSIEKNWTDFKIQVNGKNSVTIGPNEKEGNVPQALCIPSDWLWPKECINIYDAYPNFRNWVENQENFQEWHKNHIDGKVAK